MGYFPCFAGWADGRLKRGENMKEKAEVAEVVGIVQAPP